MQTRRQALLNGLRGLAAGAMAAVGLSAAKPDSQLPRKWSQHPGPCRRYRPGKIRQVSPTLWVREVIYEGAW